MALAQALPSHGAGITIDADETVASRAKRHFDVSPHGTKIELHLGDARRDCENPRRPVRSRAWHDRGRQHAVVRAFRSIGPRPTARPTVCAHPSSTCDPTPNAPRPSHRGTQAPADLGAGAVDSQAAGLRPGDDGLVLTHVIRCVSYLISPPPDDDAQPSTPRGKRARLVQHAAAENDLPRRHVRRTVIADCGSRAAKEIPAQDSSRGCGSAGHRVGRCPGPSATRILRSTAKANCCSPT